MRPLLGGRAPEMRLIRVVLPAPLGPDEAQYLALLQAEAHVANRGEAAEMLGEALGW